MARISTDKRYEVLKDGRVVNTKTGRTLKPFSRGKSGGLSVDFPSGRYYVRELVAAAYLGPKPDGKDAVLLDGDQTNLDVRNIAYMSKAENMKRWYDRSRMSSSR